MKKYVLNYLLFMLVLMLNCGFMLFFMFNCLSIMVNRPDDIKVYNYTYNITIQETSKPVVSTSVISTPKIDELNSEINTNVNLLAHIINAEAANQPYNGKLAVGTVIMNRVESTKFPNTIKDVIYQSRQFSPVSNGSINNQPTTESIEAAKDIIIHGKRIFGKDVLFFYEPNTATDEWIQTRKAVMKIGDHVFAL
jgi:N-acetylmuramoyl-L-alanine amidase